MARRPVVGPQSSVNERLVALEIVRQVLVLRFSLRLRKQLVDAINDTEQPIARMIRDGLRTDAGLRDPAQVRKLDELIAQLNAMRQPAWQIATAIATNELTELAEAEVEDQRDMFGFLLPGITLAVPLAVGMLTLASPFNGRTLGQWLEDAAADDARRIRQAIYLGVASGNTPAQIARMVVGTASSMGRDGATQTTRNHIDTIVRSGAVHFSAYPRDQFYRVNAEVRWSPLTPGMPRQPVPGVRPVGAGPDPVQAEAARQYEQARRAAAAAGAPQLGKKVFQQEQFVAVLDSRTTKLCRGLDGKRYRLGRGPIPPLHPNCRSNRVLVLPESLGGPIYDPGKYGDWIRTQPFAVQVMLMGSTKANKLSDKDLADEAFQDYGAKPMSLDEIRAETRRVMEFY